jgi:hypothetical protein
MVIPIPLEEPVMIITFPFNLFIYYLLFLLVSVSLQLTLLYKKGCGFVDEEFPTEIQKLEKPQLPLI